MSSALRMDSIEDLALAMSHARRGLRPGGGGSLCVVMPGGPGGSTCVVMPDSDI